MKLSLSLLILCAAVRSAVAIQNATNVTLSASPISCYVGARWVNASMTSPALAAAPVALLTPPVLTTGYHLCAAYTFSCDSITASIFNDVCNTAVYGAMISKYNGYTTIAALNNRLAAMAPTTGAQDLSADRICNSAGCNAPVTNCGSVSSYSGQSGLITASPTFISCTVVYETYPH